MMRQEHHTRNHFEKEYGFSQAVRIGQNIWIAGITATSPEGILFKDDMYGQACEIFR
jgi:enamine deaminase RidA (YjgF/YER057c/UK114 family)